MVVRRIPNYCGFGISDFGNKVKDFYFFQNIAIYTSEIQYPILGLYEGFQTIADLGFLISEIQ